MSETLSTKRCRFTSQLARLVVWAESQGLSVALDQVKRTQSEADANAASGLGISDSLHRLGLAADILLYRNGIYQAHTEDYHPLGVYWESLSPDARWGGRFSPKPDGDHFSLEHNGVK